MKKQKLKIATFCTNQWPTPPPKTFYAPLWIAYYIAEGLAKKGHEVFYFGSSESKLRYAKLVSDKRPAIKYNKELLSYWPEKATEIVGFEELMMVSKIYQMNKIENFDIIHIHPYRRCIPFAPFNNKTPTVITIHDPIEGFNKYMISWTKKFPQIFLVSLSNNQRESLPKLNYIATIYNGIDLEKFKFNDKPEDYFVAAGRFVPEKGIDLAIEVAKKAKIKLKIAGGPAKGEYFETKIKPYLNKNIEYLGMLNYYQMGELYKKAKAILYPLRWEEPFGLVIIEAMACGTPVIGFNRGSLPEIIKDKKTGFIVKNVPAMVKVVKKIDQIERKECRKWVEQNFTIEKMVDRYEEIFSKLAGQKI